MKRNLLFLSSAMFLTAMNAQAESFWLILQNSTYGIEKIEMKNMSQCEEQGKQYRKKFRYSSLLVLNWQIRKSIQKNALRGTTG